MHICDEGVRRIDEAPRRDDGRARAPVTTGSRVLHFVLQDPHFVANGFVIISVSRTMIQRLFAEM